METRYDRQLMLPQIGSRGQEKLSRASVLIVGVGGLGSAVSLYLTAAGVGRIGLVDCDTVSLTNLQRQVLYTEAEVELPKAVCAARRLNALNRHTAIDMHDMRLTAENADAVIAQYDMVVDGCDNFETRFLIDDVCARQGKPYVYGTVEEFCGQVSVFGYGDGKRYGDLFADREALCSAPKRVPGVMGAVPGTIGCLEASEAIKIITGCGEVLSGRLLLVDMLTMQMQTIDI